MNQLHYKHFQIQDLTGFKTCKACKSVTYIVVLAHFFNS